MGKKRGGTCSPVNQGGHGKHVSVHGSIKVSHSLLGMPPWVRKRISRACKFHLEKKKECLVTETSDVGGINRPLPRSELGVGGFLLSEPVRDPHGSNDCFEPFVVRPGRPGVEDPCKGKQVRKLCWMAQREGIRSFADYEVEWVPHL